MGFPGGMCSGSCEDVPPGALQARDETRLCRDDSLFARVSETQGACIPPYFLFQLRVDGHPDPG